MAEEQAQKQVEVCQMFPATLIIGDRLASNIDSTNQPRKMRGPSQCAIVSTHALPEIAHRIVCEDGGLRTARGGER